MTDKIMKRNPEAKFIIEHDVINDDYRQVVIRNCSGGVQHRCGYVGVLPNHPLHGKDYDADSTKRLKDMQVSDTDPMGTFIQIFKLEENEEAFASISYAAEIHGGITYARGGDHPAPDTAKRWWFGFDCAHAGDDRDSGGQPLDYVIKECGKLEQFLRDQAKG